jgi:hypothetical protein
MTEKQERLTPAMLAYFRQKARDAIEMDDAVKRREAFAEFCEVVDAERAFLVAECDNLSIMNHGFLSGISAMIERVNAMASERIQPVPEVWAGSRATIGAWEKGARHALTGGVRRSPDWAYLAPREAWLAGYDAHRDALAPPAAAPRGDDDTGEASA